MSIINIEALRRVLAKDPEFVRAIRYYDGKIKLSVEGKESYVIAFEDGRTISAGPAGQENGDCRIEVEGTVDHWKNLLQPLPTPFYQCLQSSAVKHSMRMTVNNETYAYLPALNRMIQLMRQLRAEG